MEYVKVLQDGEISIKIPGDGVLEHFCATRVFKTEQEADAFMDGVERGIECFKVHQSHQNAVAALA